MDSLVIYATRTGNTRACAEAIAESLRRHGPVHIRSVEEGLNGDLERADLLVIGGPTEGHGMTEPVKLFLDRIIGAGLDDVVAAAFDTRVDWPKVLSGSAAKGIAKRLAEAGVPLVVTEESFLVTNKPELQPGELERAAAWGARLGEVAAAMVAGRGAPATV